MARSGLIFRLTRWLALGLYRLAARLDPMRAHGRADPARAPGPAPADPALAALAEQYPGAPEHWLRAIAAHLGSGGAAQAAVPAQIPLTAPRPRQPSWLDSSTASPSVQDARFGSFVPSRIRPRPRHEQRLAARTPPLSTRGGLPAPFPQQPREAAAFRPATTLIGRLARRVLRFSALRQSQTRPGPMPADRSPAEPGRAIADFPGPSQVNGQRIAFSFARPSASRPATQVTPMGAQSPSARWPETLWHERARGAERPERAASWPIASGEEALDALPHDPPLTGAPMHEPLWLGQSAHSPRHGNIAVPQGLKLDQAVPSRLPERRSPWPALPPSNLSVISDAEPEPFDEAAARRNQMVSQWSA